MRGNIKLTRQDLSEIVYRIEAHEATPYVLAMCQVLAGVFGFAYTNLKTTPTFILFPYVSVFAYMSVFFQCMVLLFFGILIYMSWKYRVIKLRLNRANGILFDKTTSTRNVSLRDESLNLIIDGIDEQKRYDIGKKVGENFYNHFDKKLSLKNAQCNADDKFIKWLDYDSSSGMGRFQPLHNSLTQQLTIVSPFVGDCENDPNKKKRCNFLLGYIDGFCSRLYATTVKCKCDHDTQPLRCKISLERNI